MKLGNFVLWRKLKRLVAHGNSQNSTSKKTYSIADIFRSPLYRKTALLMGFNFTATTLVYYGNVWEFLLANYHEKIRIKSRDERCRYFYSLEFVSICQTQKFIKVPCKCQHRVVHAVPITLAINLLEFCWTLMNLCVWWMLAYSKEKISGQYHAKASIRVMS